MKELERNLLFANAHRVNENYLKSIEEDASAEDQIRLLRIVCHYRDEICREGLSHEYSEYCRINYREEAWHE